MADENVKPLSLARIGMKGVITGIRIDAGPGDGQDLERRLLEMGFVEGARVELLHQGAIGGCPIAIKLDDMRVALRRREAAAVMIDFDRQEP